MIGSRELRELAERENKSCREDFKKHLAEHKDLDIQISGVAIALKNPLAAVPVMSNDTIFCLVTLGLAKHAEIIADEIDELARLQEITLGN